MSDSKKESNDKVEGQNVVPKRKYAKIEQDRGIHIAAQAKQRDVDMSRRKANEGLIQMNALPKAIFIKFWFAGAVYFFIGWAWQFAGFDRLDIIAIVGILIGLASDLIANRVLLGIDNSDSKMPQYIMFSSRKFYYLFLNVLYSLLIVSVVVAVYVVINQQSSTVFGVEPILFGVLYTLFDFVFLIVRNLIAKHWFATKSI